MAETKAQWYIPGRDRKPAGPYTTEQVLRALRIGRVTRQSICWREGMADWLPIEQIPAIAHLLQPAQAQRGLIRFRCSCGNEIVMSHKFSGKQAKCSGCGAIVTVPAVVGNETAEKPTPKPKRSFVSKLIVLFVLAGLGAGAYFFVVADYLKLNKAKELIEKGSYRKASRELRGLDKSFLFKNQAQYLDGLIEVYEYAAAEEPHEISVAQILQEGNPLSAAQRSLKKACRAEPKCAELAKGDLAKAIEIIPADTSDRLARILAINLLRKELATADPKQLAREVVEELRGNVDFQQRFSDYQSLVTMLLDWDASLMSDLLTAMLPKDAAGTLIHARNLRLLFNWLQSNPALQSAYPDAILTCAKQQLESDPLDTVVILKNAQEYLPKEKQEEVATLYLQAALKLKESNPNDARAALTSALQIKPDIAQSESEILLCIEYSSKADETKLAQYQLFLSKYPKSAERAKVLSMLVADATTVGNQQGFYQRTPKAPYLDAALPTATELLAAYPQTPELDRTLENLARTLHKNKRPEEALDLVKKILAKLPETSLKFEIEQDIVQWTQQPSDQRSTVNSYTVPPDPLEVIVENEMKTKFMTVTNPSQMRTLTERPNTIRIAQISKDCTLKLFTSEELESLKNWIRGGGILWVRSDVLQGFGIDFKKTGSGFPWECTLSIPQTMCPILTDCAKIEISADPLYYDLLYRGAIPLWKTRIGSSEVCVWSLVPYGRGWISDVKTVNEQTYDGKRLWLNFRLFCLGRVHDIPNVTPETMKQFRDRVMTGAPKISEISPGEEATPGKPTVPTGNKPTIIDDPTKLEEAIKAPPTQKVVWIKLSQRDLSRAQQQSLKAWVGQGGVIWLESDLVKVFAFPGLITIPSKMLKGECFVFSAKHPITQGIDGLRCQYEMVPNQVAVRIPSRFQAPKGDVKPLLVIEPAYNRFLAIGAFKAYQKGYVILRPAKILTDTPTGKKFDQNLLAFSFNPTPQEATPGYHPVP